MDKWSIAHRYKKLVEAGIASPLTAPDGTEYILKANKEYEPVYWISTTDRIITPGSSWWSNLRDKIDSYDLENIETELTTYDKNKNMQ